MCGASGVCMKIRVDRDADRAVGGMMKLYLWTFGVTAALMDRNRRAVAIGANRRSGRPLKTPIKSIDKDTRQDGV